MLVYLHTYPHPHPFTHARTHAHTHTHLEQFVRTLEHTQRHSCHQNWTLLYSHTVKRGHTQDDARKTRDSTHTHSLCHHPETSWACTACPITMWQLLLVALYVGSLLQLYLHPVITPPFSALGQVASPHAHTSPHLQGTELHPSKAYVQGAVRCPSPHLGAWQVCQVSYRDSPQSNLSR